MDIAREALLKDLLSYFRADQRERYPSLWAETEEYDLVALDDEGNWKVLASAVTYEDADNRLDVYSDQFPHAILDILPHNDNA